MVAQEVQEHLGSYAFCRINPSYLHPLFLKRLRGLIAAAAKRGVEYWAISGYRSIEEQAALYAKGREGDYVFNKSLVVTNAKPGYSAHNYGIAVDLCKDGFTDRAGLQPSYKPGDYSLLGELAPRFGLLWGGTFKMADGPHIQLPGYVSGKELEALRVLYMTGGMEAVHKKITEALGDK